MADLTDVRRAALELPESVETSHFGMPGFSVRGRGFLSVSKDGSRLLLHATPEVTAGAVAEDPDVYTELRRGATLLGIDADLGAVPVERLKALVRHAYQVRAPERLGAAVEPSSV